MFGDDVAVHLTHISDEEKAKLDATIGVNTGIRAPVSQKNQALNDILVTADHVENN